MFLRTVLFLILGEHLQKNNSPFSLIKGFVSWEMLKYCSFSCKKVLSFIFTKSQESWVWKRPLQVALSNVLAWAVWTKAGWSGPCPDKFLLSSETDTPYPLRASRFSVPSDLQQKKFKNYVLTVSPQQSHTPSWVPCSCCGSQGQLTWMVSPCALC